MSWTSTKSVVVESGPHHSTIIKKISPETSAERVLYSVLQQLRKVFVEVRVTVLTDEAEEIVVYSTEQKPRPLFHTDSEQISATGQSGGGRIDTIGASAAEHVMRFLSVFHQTQTLQGLIQIDESALSARTARVFRGGTKRKRDEEMESRKTAIDSAGTILGMIKSATDTLGAIVTPRQRTIDEELAPVLERKGVLQISICFRGPVHTVDFGKYERLEKEVVHGDAEHFSFVDAEGRASIFSLEIGTRTRDEQFQTTLKKIEELRPHIQGTKLAYFYDRVMNQKVVLFI